MDRVNDILLGPLERPALAWLCRRMPAWVTPDVLTLVGRGVGVCRRTEQGEAQQVAMALEEGRPLGIEAGDPPFAGVHCEGTPERRDAVEIGAGIEGGARPRRNQVGAARREQLPGPALPRVRDAHRRHHSRTPRYP